MEKKPTPTYIKVAVLFFLIAVLIAAVVIPIKVIPNAGSNIAATLTSLFIPHKKTATTTPDVAVSPSTTPDSTTTPQATQNITTIDTTTPVSTPIVKVTNSTPVVSGPADLKTTITSVGYIDSNSGNFVASDSVKSSDLSAVKFTIQNVGGNATGVWKFHADLPSDTDPKFDSDAQPALAPGDKIDYVLSFENIKNAPDNFVIVTADPTNNVSENNKTNNTAKAKITNSDYTSSTTVITNTGKPDLTIKLVETGYMDDTSKFIKSATVPAGKWAALRGEVQNLGATFTTEWRFTSTIPSTDTTNTYTSDLQKPLKSGEKAMFTISFDKVRYGTNTFDIKLDSENKIDEANENNNFASVSIVK